MKIQLLTIITAAIIGISLYQSTLKQAQTLRISTIPVNVASAYTDWKSKYGMLWSSPQENDFRLQVFYQNYLEIQKVNSKNMSWEAGINQFTALTREERKAKYGMNDVPPMEDNESDFTTTPDLDQNLSLPSSLNWMDKNVIPKKIQNQGSCGSCWIYGATAAAEGVYTIAKRKSNPSFQPLKFSEQQLLDCIPQTSGCSGGWSRQVFLYLIGTSGITQQSSYRYKGVKSWCKKDKIKNPTPKFGKFFRVKGGKNSLLKALQNGPVVLWFKVDDNFYSYKKGVYNPSSCVAHNGNHIVTAVGYSTSGGNPYVIIRNSWGGKWGENGYGRMRLLDSKEGLCGMYTLLNSVTYTNK